jgi:hypothetical protein
LEIPGGSAVSADSSSVGARRARRSPIAAIAAKAKAAADKCGSAVSADRRPVGSHRVPVGAIAGPTEISEAIGAILAVGANHLLRASAAHQGEGNSGDQQEPRQERTIESGDFQCDMSPSQMCESGPLTPRPALILPFPCARNDTFP